jgi:hypothetical protein
LDEIGLSFHALETFGFGEAMGRKIKGKAINQTIPADDNKQIIKTWKKQTSSTYKKYKLKGFYVHATIYI